MSTSGARQVTPTGRPPGGPRGAQAPAVSLPRRSKRSDEEDDRGVAEVNTTNATNDNYSHETLVDGEDDGEM